MLTTWHCPHSPAARRCCSNRSTSGPLGPQQQTCSSSVGLLLGAHAGTDRRIDRRTDTVPFRRPAPDMRAVPTTLNWTILTGGAYAVGEQVSGRQMSDVREGKCQVTPTGRWHTDARMSAAIVNLHGRPGVPRSLLQLLSIAR